MLQNWQLALAIFSSEFQATAYVFDYLFYLAFKPPKPIPYCHQLLGHTLHQSCLIIQYQFCHFSHGQVCVCACVWHTLSLYVHLPYTHAHATPISYWVTACQQKPDRIIFWQMATQPRSSQSAHPPSPSTGEHVQQKLTSAEHDVRFIRQETFGEFSWVIKLLRRQNISIDVLYCKKRERKAENTVSDI